MPNELVLHNQLDRTNFVSFRYEGSTLTVSTHELDVDDWRRTFVRLSREQMIAIASWILEERD